MSWETCAFFAMVGWILGAIGGSAARSSPYSNLMECVRRISQNPLTGIVVQKATALGIFHSWVHLGANYGPLHFEQTTMWIRVTLVLVASGILLVCKEV